MAEPHFNFSPEELQSEEWRPILGYEGLYSVSSLGRVWREPNTYGCRNGRFRKPQWTTAGYFFLWLSKDNQVKSWHIHDLVTLAFFGPKPDGLCVNHKDGVPTNNRVGNLEYVTYRENAMHALDVLGQRAKICGDNHPLRRRPELAKRGENCHYHKLTEDDVRQIRAAYKPGVTTLKELAEQWNVTFATIGRIVRRDSWTHID